MKPYNLHPELQSLKRVKAIINRRLLPLVNFFMGIMFPLKSDDRVTVKKYTVAGYKKGTINISTIESKARSEKKYPALIFYHGGAFCLKASGSHYRLAKEYAVRLSCKVIYVDYRLAPKYAFPYALEDCFTAYKWALKHADALHIDRNQCIIGGDSAGGNLAIGVIRLAMKQKLLLPKAALLIYPVIDQRMLTPSMQAFTDTPVWNAVLNKKMWEMYLPNQEAKAKYSSLMECDFCTGFPKTYLEVAEYDCLRDEGIAFGEKLKANAVEVNMIKVSGACHGFEVARNSSVTREAMDRRINFCANVIGGVDPFFGAKPSKD